MNPIRIIQNGLIIAAGIVSLNLSAADPAKKAPHGGRLMEVGGARLEFVVESDKKANVYLYDDQWKPVVPTDQSVTLMVQAKDQAKVKTDLIKKSDSFASEAPLAIPDGAKAILVIKTGGKIHNLRFDLDMSLCGECKNPEYACSCGH